MAFFDHERQRLMGNSSELIVPSLSFRCLTPPELGTFPDGNSALILVCARDFSMLPAPSGRQGIHVHEAPDGNGNHICEQIEKMPQNVRGFASSCVTLDVCGIFRCVAVNGWISTRLHNLLLPGLKTILRINLDSTGFDWGK